MFVSAIAAELNVLPQAVEAVINGDTALTTDKQRETIMKRFGNDGRGVFICAVWKGSARSTAARHMPSYDYFGQLLEGVNLYLYKAGYTLQLFVSSAPIADQEYFEYILVSHPNAGIIHLNSTVSQIIRLACQKFNRPIVFLDFPIDDDPSDAYFISMKSETLIEEAVRYLYRLGHRRIAFIRGPLTKQTELGRYKGYLAGLNKLGLDRENDLIMAGNWHEPTGMMAVEKFLGLPSPPTAIIASNDLIACEAMTTLQKKGLKIPDDMSIIGYDDLAIASMSSPPLTSVRTPMTQMGMKAGEMMVSLLEGKSPEPRQVYFPLELVIRASTGAASRLQK